MRSVIYRWLTPKTQTMIGWAGFNDIIVHLWPHIATAASHMVREQAQPLLQQNKPRCSACPFFAHAALASSILVVDYCRRHANTPCAHVTEHPGKKKKWCVGDDMLHIDLLCRARTLLAWTVALFLKRNCQLSEMSYVPHAGGCQNVSLHTFTLGNIPPRVFGIKVCLFNCPADTWKGPWLDTLG